MTSTPTPATPPATPGALCSVVSGASLPAGRVMIRAGDARVGMTLDTLNWRGTAPNGAPFTVERIVRVPLTATADLIELHFGGTFLTFHDAAELAVS